MQVNAQPVSSLEENSEGLLLQYGWECKPLRVSRAADWFVFIASCIAGLLQLAVLSSDPDWIKNPAAAFAALPTVAAFVVGLKQLLSRVEE